MILECTKCTKCTKLLIYKGFKALASVQSSVLKRGKRVLIDRITRRKEQGMTEKECLDRLRAGNFNGGYGFDMQLLVDTVGHVGEMMRNGRLILLEPLCKWLSETFGCPCNYSPIDEQMAEICVDTCQMDDDAECWRRVMKKLVIKEDT